MFKAQAWGFRLHPSYPYKETRKSPATPDFKEDSHGSCPNVYPKILQSLLCRPPKGTPQIWENLTSQEATSGVAALDAITHTWRVRGAKYKKIILGITKATMRIIGISILIKPP